MGNQIDQKTLKIEFIQYMQDDHFGDIEIFKSQQGKFIMKHIRTFIVDDKRHKEFITQLQCLDKVQSKCIASLQHCQRKKNTNLCIDYQIVEMYIEYFNFTLYDMIKANKHVEMSQVWLCFKQLVLLGKELEQSGYTINIDINTVFITLKGLPIIYPIFLIVKHSQNQLKHPMINNIANCIIKLATNEIFANESALDKIDKINKRLGQILREMVHADQLSYITLLQNIQQYLSRKQVKIVNEIKLNKFRYLIPASVDDVSQYTSVLPSYRPLYQIQHLPNIPINPKSQHKEILQSNEDPKKKLMHELERKKLQNQLLMQKLQERKIIMKQKANSEKQNQTEASLKNSKVMQSKSYTRKVILSQCKIRDSFKRS